MEKENEKVKEQEWENITILELNAEFTKSWKWKSPGIDKVPNFWLNTVSSSHVLFTILLNEIMQNPENECAREWMCNNPENECAREWMCNEAMTQKTLTTIDRSLVFQQPANF